MNKRLDENYNTGFNTLYDFTVLEKQAPCREEASWG